MGGLIQSERNDSQVEDVFPLSCSALQIHSGLIKDFKLAQAQDGLQLHFFPLFLKTQKISKSICDLAQLEWIRHECSCQLSNPCGAPDVLNFRNEGLAQRLRLNPLIRIISLDASVPQFDLEKGLWCIASDRKGGWRANKLNAAHAFFVDALSEGVAYNSESLLELYADGEACPGATAITRGGPALAELIEWQVILV